MKKYIVLLLFAFILFQFSACEQENIVESGQQCSNNVSIDEAVLVGTNHFSISNESSLKSKKILPDFKSGKIKEKRAIKNNDEDLMYIINYENGGFVIVSGDRRVTPILAYSETNNFLDEDLPGISDWINAVSQGIIEAKKTKKARKEVARLWEIYTGEPNVSINMIEPIDDCNCDEYYESFSTGQFVDAVARWSQGYEYSWYSPNDGGCNCGRKPAGCGPVAMAMIMNYYQYPQMTMTWSGESLTTNYPMPQTIPYSCGYPLNANDRQVAMLIRLCGSWAGSVYGILGNCATATYPWNINNAFTNMFYSNGGTLGNLSDQYANVKSDLESYHPVIFIGTTGSLNANDAHIWVGDGYSYLHYQVKSTYIDQNGETQCLCEAFSREMISMNWGFGGSGNAFYIANYAFTINGNTYDTYLHALTGIRP